MIVRAEAGYRGNMVRGSDETNSWLENAIPEDIIQPDLAIIDAHHHLMEHHASGLRYLEPDFATDTSAGHRIVASVLVESRTRYRSEGPASRRSLGEIEFGRAVGEQHRSASCRVAAAIVGRVDLLNESCVAEILSEATELSRGRLKSIRHPATFHSGPIGSHIPTPCTEGLLSSPSFRKGYAHLASFDLAFDAWIFHTQIGELAGLADAFPRIPIALNHLGGILGVDIYREQRKDVLRQWSQALQELSRRPNVFIKIGGLGMPSVGFDLDRRFQPPNSLHLATAWRPYIEHAVEVFGPSRCMFESNFPIDKQSYSYVAGWNAFKRLSAQYTKEEQGQLFCGTARSFYSIPISDERRENRSAAPS